MKSIKNLPKKAYFADTYALVEILKGNKSYKEYKSSILCTTKMNLIELYSYLIREYEEKEANIYLISMQQMLVEISIGSIRKGVKYKLENKKDNISYIDALGYKLAEELGIPFLTGDIKFKNREKVEFAQ